MKWCAVVIAFVSALALAQPAGPRGVTTADAVVSMRDRLPTLSSRLGTLSPDRPEAYFLLAEEVSALARTDAEYLLAERLFVLAFVLDDPDAPRGERRSGQWRAPACLALAAISASDRRARWLLAIAGAVDPRYAQPDWSGAVDPETSPRHRVAAATAVAAVRSGDGALARSLLSRPGVRTLMQRYSALLTGRGPSGVIGELEAEAAKWPCPECRNERLSVKRHTGTIQRSLCNTCLGNPGWPLTRGGLIAALRFESAMLRGVQRSWGAQAAIDLGAPLRDPDPAELAPTYRVDPSAVYWRDGAWVAEATTSRTTDDDRSEP